MLLYFRKGILLSSSYFLFVESCKTVFSLYTLVLQNMFAYMHQYTWELIGNASSQGPIQNQQSVFSQALEEILSSLRTLTRRTHFSASHSPHIILSDIKELLPIR